MQKPRKDGYVNVLNNFGTSRDSSTGYQYEADGIVPDINLTMQYENDGLFARIINYPPEEALKHGYDFDGMDEDAKKLTNDVLDYIDWDENVITALKWSRLYGGSIIVMLIDDGGRLEDPLRYEAIRSIDELRVFERAIVAPDYTSMYNFGGEAELLKHRRSNFGMPQWYYVFSQFGSFKVHESRCLVFRNGRMPERSSQELYRFWGIPEYLRIRKKMQEADTSTSYATKLLERAVQPVYGMKGLSDMLSTESGEGDLLRRLQTIDLSRGLLNSMVIDAEGESYEFKTAQLSGVKEVIEGCYGMLSAVTGIAQTVLLGRSPSGMNATGDSDMDVTYALVERLQRTQAMRPSEKLVDIILLALRNRGKISEMPDFKVKFNPLKTVSEQEQANIDQQKAATQQVRSQTAQTYVDMGALDPSEVRQGLGKSGEFDVEGVLDDLTDEELLEMPGGGDPGLDPAAQQQPAPQIPDAPHTDADDKEWITVNGAAVPVDKDGGLGGAAGAKIEAEDKKSPGNSQEGVASSDQSGIIRGQRQPKGTKATLDQHKAIEQRLVGKTTKDGRTIKIVNPHASDRMVQRGIPESVADDVLTSKESSMYPGNRRGKDKTPKTCYQKDGTRMVVKDNTSEVWTAVDLNTEEDD